MQDCSARYVRDRPVAKGSSTMVIYSHGPVSAAVILAFAWTFMAVINNICLKRRPGWSYAELTTFCWGAHDFCACQLVMRLAHKTERLACRQVDVSILEHRP